MRGPVFWILALLAGGTLPTAPATGRENRSLAFHASDPLSLEVEGSRFPLKVEELVLPEGYSNFDPRVHFPPYGGVELFFSFGGDEPRTEL